MNMIEFALCAEDRQRLDAILAELQKFNESCQPETINIAVADLYPESTPEAPQSEPAAEPVQTPAEEPKAEAPKAPQVSVAELQAKVVELVSAGKRDEAKAVVNEYAERVSDIPEDKRHEVMQKLAALEG